MNGIIPVCVLIMIWVPMENPYMSTRYRQIDTRRSARTVLVALQAPRQGLLHADTAASEAERSPTGQSVAERSAAAELINILIHIDRGQSP